MKSRLFKTSSITSYGSIKTIEYTEFLTIYQARSNINRKLNETKSWHRPLYTSGMWIVFSYRDIMLDILKWLWTIRIWRHFFLFFFLLQITRGKKFIYPKMRQVLNDLPTIFRRIVQFYRVTKICKEMYISMWMWLYWRHWFCNALFVELVTVCIYLVGHKSKHNPLGHHLFISSFINDMFDHFW